MGVIKLRLTLTAIQSRVSERDRDFLSHCIIRHTELCLLEFKVSMLNRYLRYRVTQSFRVLLADNQWNFQQTRAFAQPRCVFANAIPAIDHGRKLLLQV